MMHDALKATGLVIVLAFGVPPAVAAGEPGGEHWAFRPIGRPEPPAVRDASWPANEIDRFVLARLESAGLSPSPRADRRTLARRAYVDLIGLPPTYDELRAFDGDPGDDAEALGRLVDRLLARPEHGERWARHWLDVARYSDTKGYVDAGEPRYPFAWTYRDWVIRALDEDMPFDRFVLAQIAADRLVESGGDRRDLAALGFLTVGSRYNFFPHEIVDDRIDVVSRGLMGLTLTCARCHDHKYDPLTMADYYALYSVFASSREPAPDELAVLADEDGGGREDGDEAFRKELAEKAAAYHGRRQELHRRIMREMREWSGDYLRYIVETTPEHRTVDQPPLRTERGLLREFTAYGRGAVVRWRRFIEERGDRDRVFGFWNRLAALGREEIAGAASRVLAELERAGAVNSIVAAAFEERPPQSMADVAEVYGGLLEETERLWKELLERDAAAAAFDDPAREELRQALHGPDAPATVTLDESEDLYHLDEHSDVRAKFAEIERVFLKAKGALPRAMALVDRPEPLEQRVFLRGDPGRPGERIDRRFPAFLASVRAGPFTDGSGRLELARALVDPRNPLTARVIVNRVWGWHVGRGLVATPSDFGSRSAAPSHPELLDWLASWFIENGWSLKKLHRLIVLSSAWAQASDDRPGARRVDPENALLWRMNRRRLGFEAMRDSMLAVAGRLEPRRGGPPLDEAPDDPAAAARTVYCFLDREKVPGVLRVFDVPSPDISCPERSRTTVPQQALFLLNSRFVIAQAEALAASLDDAFDGGEVDGRIRRLYRAVLARDPEPEEVRLAARFVEERGAAAEPPAAAGEPAAWRHGFGEYDEERGRLASFTPLPHFTGTHWQGGPAWPDPELHHLRLTARGGHAGIDRAHAAVRRWVAPRDGVVSISGRLVHGEEDCGDGVRAWISSSAAGELGRWIVYKGGADAAVESIEVTAGDSIDFVVDCRENHFCDLFEWAPVVRLVAASVEGAVDVWDAARDFGGDETSARPAPSPWVELAQVLLQSNEFLFAD